MAHAAALMALVSCAHAVPEPEVQPEPPLELDLLTYNVWMLPGVSRDMAVRAGAIPMLVDGTDYDALVLTEAFAEAPRDVLVRAFEERGYHHAEVLGAHAPSHCRSQLGPIEIGTSMSLNGGVLLFAREPIEAADELLFGDLCAGEDCCSAKGVSYIRFRKEGTCVHLFGTHLQNQTPIVTQLDPSEVRQQQVTAIRAFIDATLASAPCGGPVLLAGDLNYLPEDWEEAAREFAWPSAIEGPASWGGDGNRYVETDAPEHLDYLVAVRPGPAPRHARMQTHLFRAELDVARGLLGVRRHTQVTDLSDHHPVSGHFAFDR